MPPKIGEQLRRRDDAHSETTLYIRFAAATSLLLSRSRRWGQPALQRCRKRWVSGHFFLLACQYTGFFKLFICEGQIQSAK